MLLLPNSYEIFVIREIARPKISLGGGGGVGGGGGGYGLLCIVHQSTIQLHLPHPYFSFPSWAFLLNNISSCSAII
jgi:hypothetical protein